MDEFISRGLLLCPRGKVRDSNSYHVSVAVDISLLRTLASMPAHLLGLVARIFSYVSCPEFAPASDSHKVS